jgi:hypothetical protein
VLFLGQILVANSHQPTSRDPASSCFPEQTFKKFGLNEEEEKLQCWFLLDQYRAGNPPD